MLLCASAGATTIGNATIYPVAIHLPFSGRIIDASVTFHQAGTVEEVVNGGGTYVSKATLVSGTTAVSAEKTLVAGTATVTVDLTPTTPTTVHAANSIIRLKLQGDHTNDAVGGIALSVLFEPLQPE